MLSEEDMHVRTIIIYQAYNNIFAYHNFPQSQINNAFKTMSQVWCHKVPLYDKIKEQAI